MQIALTIAGSDSGGGAGIQADIKTFARFGVFGTSAITAVTAQNTRGVMTWEPLSAPLVQAQIDAVFDDLSPHAVKTGMLGSTAVVQTVIGALMIRRPQHLVVDPVMVASSGDVLLDANAVALVRDELVPLATLVTPNLDEARVLLDMPVRTVDDMMMAAKRLVQQFGAKAALVKGGHLDRDAQGDAQGNAQGNLPGEALGNIAGSPIGDTTGDTIVDVLYDGQHHVVLRHNRVASQNTHGTGCTLSAAVTAHMALGRPLYDSVQIATEYVHNAIATAPGLGSGHGPINHFAASDATNPVTSA